MRISRSIKLLIITLFFILSSVGLAHADTLFYFFGSHNRACNGSVASCENLGSSGYDVIWQVGFKVFSPYGTGGPYLALVNTNDTNNFWARYVNDTVSPPFRLTNTSSVRWSTGCYDPPDQIFQSDGSAFETGTIDVTSRSSNSDVSSGFSQQYLDWYYDFHGTGTYIPFDNFSVSNCKLPNASSISNFTLSCGSSTSINADWFTLNHASYYEVQYKRSSTSTWTALSNTTNTAKTISGLTSGVGYDVRVRGHTNYPYPGPTNWATASTTCGSSSTTPNPPTNTTAVSSCNGSTNAKVDFEWSAIANDASYDLRYRKSGTTTWTTLTGIGTSLGSDGKVHKVVSGLSFGTTYEWEVLGHTDAGFPGPTPWSSIATVTTVSSSSCTPVTNPPTPTPGGSCSAVQISGTTMCSSTSYTCAPGAPTVTATASCNGTKPQISTYWSAVTNSNGAYDVRYKPSGGTYVTAACGVSRATSTTPYLISSALLESTSYTVQVRSHTSSGVNGPTDFGSATVTTPKCSTSCVRNDPDLTVVPETNSGTAGQTKKYRITVTNTNSSSCTTADTFRTMAIFDTGSDTNYIVPTFYDTNGTALTPVTDAGTVSLGRGYYPPNYTLATGASRSIDVAIGYNSSAVTGTKNLHARGSNRTDTTFITNTPFTYNLVPSTFSIKGGIYVDTPPYGTRELEPYVAAGSIGISPSGSAASGTSGYTFTGKSAGNYTLTPSLSSTTRDSSGNLWNTYQFTDPNSGALPPTISAQVGVGPTYTCDTTNANYDCDGLGNVISADFGIKQAPVAAWYQTVGGDIRINAGFKFPIPSSTLFLADNLAAPAMSAGLVFSGNSNADVAPGQLADSSPTNQVVKNQVYSAGPSGIKTSYDNVSANTQKNRACYYDVASATSKCTPSLSAAPCGGSTSSCTLTAGLPTGVYRSNGDLGLNTYSFTAGRKYIFLIDGDLTIHGNITVPPGAFAIFVVRGNITVDSNVTNIQGVYSADGSFTASGNGGIDTQLNVGGNIIAHADTRQALATPFVNNRDLDSGNNDTPSIKITYRPDFILYAPDLIKIATYKVSEIAPPGASQ